MEAMKAFFALKGLPHQVRIHLQSTGCCDASLGLTADEARPDDLVYDVEDITFIVSPEVSVIAGDITISYQSDKFNSGFVLTSERPISEWSGFGVCSIKA